MGLDELKDKAAQSGVGEKASDTGIEKASDAAGRQDRRRARRAGRQGPTGRGPEDRRVTAGFRTHVAAEPVFEGPPAALVSRHVTRNAVRGAQPSARLARSRAFWASRSRRSSSLTRAWAARRWAVTVCSSRSARTTGDTSVAGGIAVWSPADARPRARRGRRAAGRGRARSRRGPGRSDRSGPSASAYAPDQEHRCRGWGTARRSRPRPAPRTPSASSRRPHRPPG